MEEVEKPVRLGETKQNVYVRHWCATQNIYENKTYEVISLGQSLTNIAIKKSKKYRHFDPRIKVFADIQNSF